MSYFGREKAFEGSKSYSTKSFKTLEDSSLPCPHCKFSKEETEVQILQLKDKAHQSFMQVLYLSHDLDKSSCCMTRNSPSSEKSTRRRRVNPNRSWSN
jgi:hypothetical protein